MKKALAIMFYASNTNKDFNADKYIVHVNDYLNKKNLIQNKNFNTNQKNLNMRLLNFNIVKSRKDLFASAYEKNKLVQTIIDLKVQKLTSQILEQVKLAMRNLEVKNDKNTSKTKYIYVIVRNFNYIYGKNIIIFQSRVILVIKLYFEICKPDISSLIQ